MKIHSFDSNEFDCANAHSYLLDAYFNGSMAPNRGKIDDTFDFPEAQIPEGFKLALRLSIEIDQLDEID